MNITNSAEIEKLTCLADIGDLKAQMALVRMYLSGRGVAIDKDKAIKWFQKAADQLNDDELDQLTYL